MAPVTPLLQWPPKPIKEINRTDINFAERGMEVFLADWEVSDEISDTITSCPFFDLLLSARETLSGGEMMEGMSSMWCRKSDHDLKI